MIGQRRWPVWVANGGLVLGGLLLAARWLGLDQDPPTGTTPFGWPLAVLLFVIAWSAALRLHCSHRGRGLEGRAVSFFARRGLPPRDAPPTVGSALSSGAFLGGGFGFAAGAGDALRVMLATSHPGPSPLQGFAIGLVTVGTTAAAGASIGGAISLLIRRWRGGGRFDVGRATFLILLSIAPVIVLLAPAAGANRGAALPWAVALAVILTGACWFVVAPVAVSRARNHQWGLAAVSAGGILLVFVLLLLGAIGAPVPLDETTEADPEPHPNLLLVTIAGLRSDFTGSGGDGTSLSPHLLGLMQRGTQFAGAMTPSTDHLTAARALLTGRYPSVAPEPGGAPLGLAELLAAHGYRTAAFVSCECVNRDGLSLSGTFDTYEDLADLATWLARTAVARVWLAARPWRATQRPDDSTAAQFREWLGASGSGPWFAWVEFGAPARPQPGGAGEELPSLPDDWTGAEAQRPLDDPPAWAEAPARTASRGAWWQGYAAAVARADDALGVVLDALAQRGELHRTVVVAISVHGMPLGEGGAWLVPTFSLDDVVLSVPWVVAGPGVGAAREVQGPCSLVDVAPTLLGLFGLRGTDDVWEGEDLSSYLRDTARGERSPLSGPVFARVADRAGGDEPVLLARYGAYTLIRTPDGVEQLRFHAVRSTDVLDDLPNSSARERVQHELAELLSQHLARHERR